MKKARTSLSVSKHTTIKSWQQEKKRVAGEEESISNEEFSWMHAIRESNGNQIIINTLQGTQC